MGLSSMRRQKQEPKQKTKLEITVTQAKKVKALYQYHSQLSAAASLLTQIAKAGEVELGQQCSQCWEDQHSQGRGCVLTHRACQHVPAP